MFVHTVSYHFYCHVEKIVHLPIVRIYLLKLKKTTTNFSINVKLYIINSCYYIVPDCKITSNNEIYSTVKLISYSACNLPSPVSPLKHRYVDY